MTNVTRCLACGELVDKSAERCGSCGADFPGFRLLEVRVDAFEHRLAALETAIGVGERQLTLARRLTHKVTRHEHIAEVAVLGAMPVAILFVVHYLLMTISGELNARQMLIAAVAIPLPFGFLVGAGGLRRLTLWLLGSLALALVATLGMNLVSTLMHSGDVFPHSRNEAWEFVTYMVSIALSHAAGLILGLVFSQVVTRREILRDRARWQYRLAHFLVGRHYDAEHGHWAAVELLRIARLLVAVAAIAGSVYSGWLRFRS